MNIINTVHEHSEVELLGPGGEWALMTPYEFDRTEFEEALAWLYELINGVLVVTPMPLNNEVDQVEELGYLLRKVSRGSSTGFGVKLHGIRADDSHLQEEIAGAWIRAIWGGLGHPPAKKEPPTIAVEFVSKGKRSRIRDYVTKRDRISPAGPRQGILGIRPFRTLNSGPF